MGRLPVQYGDLEGVRGRDAVADVTGRRLLRWFGSSAVGAGVGVVGRRKISVADRLREFVFSP
jgi:hypothetical protein